MYMQDVLYLSNMIYIKISRISNIVFSVKETNIVYNSFLTINLYDIIKYFIYLLNK